MTERRKVFLGIGKKGDSGKPDDKQPKKLEVGFGFGKLSLGGILRGLEDFIDLVAQMEREGKKEIRREGEIKGLGPKARGIYGFTVKTGLGKKPFVETFGNIKKTEVGPQIEEVREPIVDIFDEKDHILVVVELPGVKKDDITASVKGDVLILRAKGEKHKYLKEVLLPCQVSGETKKTSYKNGILEIRFRKPRKAKK